MWVTLQGLCPRLCRGASNSSTVSPQCFSVNQGLSLLGYTINPAILDSKSWNSSIKLHTKAPQLVCLFLFMVLPPHSGRRSATWLRLTCLPLVLHLHVSEERSQSLLWHLEKADIKLDSTRKPLRPEIRTEGQRGREGAGRRGLRCENTIRLHSFCSRGINGM